MTPREPTSAVRETIHAVDGTATSLLHATPAAPRTAALLLPAMGVPARYYAKAAEALARHDIATTVLELRGQGESPLDPAQGADFGYAELLDDVSVTMRALRERFPGSPVSLIGHSLGGHLALMQAATAPGSVERVALIATATPHHVPYRGTTRWKVWLGTRMVRWVSSLFGYYPGDRLGFGGVQPKTLIREWSAMGRSGRYSLEGRSVDIEEAIRRLSLPVLALAIDGDQLAPAPACQAIVQKLSKAPVEWVEVGPPRLSPRALHHQRWAKEPGAVVDEVAAFLDRTAPIDVSPTRPERLPPS